MGEGNPTYMSWSLDQTYFFDNPPSYHTTECHTNNKLYHNTHSQVGKNSIISSLSGLKKNPKQYIFTGENINFFLNYNLCSIFFVGLRDDFEWVKVSLKSKSLPSKFELKLQSKFEL